MTEQLKNRAKIAAKGLDTTGVTEDHARAMASRLGGHHLFVVEGKAARTITDEDGNTQVVLVLTQVEPVPAAQEDTVREFMRALYRTRPDQEGQAVLRGTDDGPTVAATAAALGAQVEKDAEGQVTRVWDGSTDGPLPDLPDTAYPEGAQDVPEPDGLEGDTRPWPGDPEDGPESAAVVQFSGKQARG